MADETPAVGTGAPSGATVQSQYMARTMKCYPVHETEMEGLVEANGDATAHYSFASACLAFSVGIWTNAAFASQLTPTGQLATELAAPFLVVVALFFAFLGTRAARRRNKIWEKIRGEAVTLQASASAAVAAPAQAA